MNHYDEHENDEKKPVNAAAVALTVAGIVAAASAIYLLGIGERGQRNREKVKSWAMKAREDVKERVSAIKDITAEQYKQIVDTVMNHYKGIKNADLEEIGALGKELKEQWEDMRNSIRQPQGRSNLRQYTDDEL